MGAGWTPRGRLAITREVSASDPAPTTKSRDLSLARVRVLFLLMGALILAGLAVAYWSGATTLRTAERWVQQETVTRQVRQTFSVLQDAETGQRGYLLTQNEAYLEPYNDARAELSQRLDALRKAAADGSLPRPLAGRVEALAEEKLIELADTIATAQSQGFAAAVERVNRGAGKRTMDEVRAVFAEIEMGQRRELEYLARETGRLAALRNAIFLGLAGASLGILVWVYLRIRREMSRRYVADLEAQRQRDVLAVSLASIGDAVIITDTDSRITFLNDVAVDLTGWPREEAIGQPCARVFHIINETTRRPVESPVDLVLQSGKIVGLANHTLLVRRDGGELPIDDSGAPVRETDGTLRGVVLVFRDFSRHKAAEREQLELQARLETAGRAKDEFLAALSHELRTPLTPVLATLTEWESRPDSLPPAVRERLPMLGRNVRLEARLIDDLLDLTRIIRGQLALEREPVDVHAVLETTAEMFRPDLERRTVRLGLRLTAEQSIVDGDATRLQQVFWNILGNAAKFTPDGGRIEVVTSAEDGTLRVVFADTGRGISAAALAGLFQPFERLAAGRAPYRGSGLGIGLAISRRLVQAHGGDIQARSDGEGLGATFVVRLPLAENVAVANGALAAPAASAVTESRPLRLLLVEDHADSAEVLARILRQFNHHVTVAGTMAQGIAALREAPFDLVISDIGLPDGTGLDFIAAGREIRPVPMIALTGYGADADIARYREAGFARSLTKPVAFDQIEEMLRDFAAVNGAA